VICEGWFPRVTVFTRYACYFRAITFTHIHNKLVTSIHYLNCQCGPKRHLSFFFKGICLSSAILCRRQLRLLLLLLHQHHYTHLSTCSIHVIIYPLLLSHTTLQYPQPSTNVLRCTNMFHYIHEYTQRSIDII
jgi:hypothetical protein